MHSVVLSNELLPSFGDAQHGGMVRHDARGGVCFQHDAALAIDEARPSLEDTIRNISRCATRLVVAGRAPWADGRHPVTRYQVQRRR